MSDEWNNAERQQTYLTLQVIPILCVILIGFIGNVLMFVTLVSTPRLKTITHVLTASLMLADLGIICLVLPMWVYQLITVEVNPVLCKITAFFSISLMLVNVWTVSFISLDRYFCICHPLEYPTRMTVRKVLCTVCYTWVQSTFLASLPLYGWGRYLPHRLGMCIADWTHSPSYSIFLLFIGILVPFILLLYSYVCLFFAARKQVTRIHQFTHQLVNPWDTSPSISLPATPRHSWMRNSLRRLSSRKRSSASSAGHVYTPISKNIKTLRTIFIAVGIFVVCWLPYIILHLSYPHIPAPMAIEYLSTLLVFSLSATNPIIFILLTRDFRAAVVQLLNSCCHGNRVHPMKEQHKRIQVSVLGQEASVHIIHLKQYSGNQMNGNGSERNQVNGFTNLGNHVHLNKIQIDENHVGNTINNERNTGNQVNVLHHTNTRVPTVEVSKCNVIPKLLVNGQDEN